MCSQKWNCAASFPISTFMYLWAIYILLRSVHLFILLQERGRAVSFLGIFVSNFGSSVLAVQTTDVAFIISWRPKSRETLPLSSSCFIGGRFVKRLLHPRERDPELTCLLTGTADNPKIKVCTFYITERKPLCRCSLFVEGARTWDHRWVFFLYTIQACTWLHEWMTWKLGNKRIFYCLGLILVNLYFNRMLSMRLKSLA